MMTMDAILNYMYFKHCFTNISLKKSPEQTTFHRNLTANRTELFFFFFFFFLQNKFLLWLSLSFKNNKKLQT